MNISEATKSAFPTMRKTWEEAAFAQVAEFMSLGQSATESGSIVANLLIETAWIVAGCGVVADGKIPNKDNFRNAVEDALGRITFFEPEAQDEREK